MISQNSCRNIVEYFYPFEAIAYFDCFVTVSLNQMTRTSWDLDSSVAYIAKFHLFKGVVISCLLWSSWGKRRVFENDRELLFIRAISALVVAIGLGRLLQQALPARSRPLHDQALELVVPHGVRETTLEGWSSFPSDHAVLYFAISTAIWFGSKRLGTLAGFWTIFVILLPRIYLGYHYLTDILFGSLLGILISVGVFKLPVGYRTADSLARIQKNHTTLAYAIAFLFTYFCATLFDDPRQVGEILWRQYQRL